MTSQSDKQIDRSNQNPWIRCSEAGNKGDSLGVAYYRKVKDTENQVEASRVKGEG